MKDRMLTDSGGYLDLSVFFTANGAVFAPELALCAGGFGDMILPEDSHFGLEGV